MITTAHEGYSILQHCEPADPLPIALARRIAKTKVGDPHMDTLNRLFHHMPWPDQARCRAELARCRTAQRGGCEAMVLGRDNIAP